MARKSRIVPLPASAVRSLQRRAAAGSRDMQLAAKRIGKTLHLRGSKAVPVSVTTVQTTVAAVRQHGIKMLLSFGMKKSAAAYVMRALEVESAKPAKGPKGLKPNKATPERPLGFGVPDGPFTMECAAWDGMCGCEVYWPGGGMSCPCF